MTDEATIEAVCTDARERRGDVAAVVEAAVDRHAPLLGGRERERLVAAVIARLSGLDVLEQHLADPAVDEVVVNAGGDVWVDRAGRLVEAGTLPVGAVDVVLERVLAPTGRRADRLSPIADVRLAGGARLCAVVAPIAVGGTALAIRRHRDTVRPLTAFAREPAVVELLGDVVRSRCNVVVSGATSSGKTTLVAALLQATGDDRLVVCEDTTELPVRARNVVRLEARPDHVDAGGGVDLARLVRTALRLRPDRLVVGEFRGVEVLAAVEAMNTGHDGSISTCHANSATDALHRIETLLMQAAPTWPLAAIRRHVARSIDVVVHVARGESGDRSVAEIGEVVPPRDDATEPSVRALVSGGHAVGALHRRRAPGGPAR